VVAANAAHRAAFMDEVARLFARQESDFINMIKKDQMSYSKEGPAMLTGTRVQTGKLRRDWYNTNIRQNQSIKAMVWSTTPYAPLHEEGGLVRKTSAFGKATRPYWVHYQKRLHVGEAWQQDFEPKMQANINAAAAKFLP
jgi:phage gpG-like protein